MQKMIAINKTISLPT